MKLVDREDLPPHRRRSLHGLLYNNNNNNSNNTTTTDINLRPDSHSDGYQHNLSRAVDGNDRVAGLASRPSNRPNPAPSDTKNHQHDNDHEVSDDLIQSPEAAGREVLKRMTLLYGHAPPPLPPPTFALEASGTAAGMHSSRSRPPSLENALSGRDHRAAPSQSPSPSQLKSQVWRIRSTAAMSRLDGRPGPVASSALSALPLPSLTGSLGLTRRRDRLQPRSTYSSAAASSSSILGKGMTLLEGSSAYHRNQGRNQLHDAIQDDDLEDPHQDGRNFHEQRMGQRRHPPRRGPTIRSDDDLEDFVSAADRNRPPVSISSVPLRSCRDQDVNQLPSLKRLESLSNRGRPIASPRSTLSRDPFETRASPASDAVQDFEGQSPVGRPVAKTFDWSSLHIRTLQDIDTQQEIPLGPRPIWIRPRIKRQLVIEDVDKTGLELSLDEFKVSLWSTELASVSVTGVVLTVDSDMFPDYRRIQKVHLLAYYETSSQRITQFAKEMARITSIQPEIIPLPVQETILSRSTRSRTSGTPPESKLEWQGSARKRKPTAPIVVDLCQESDLDDSASQSTPTTRRVATGRVTRSGRQLDFSAQEAALLFHYPMSGKHRITITMGDKNRLQEGEFLNDSVIDFYLKYLSMEIMAPSIRERVHIYSTFFYHRMTQRQAGGFERVKNWTARVDLFTMDYLVVPINESLHWYLALVCFPGRFLRRLDSPSAVSLQRMCEESLRSKSLDDLLNRTTILIFDSLGVRRDRSVKLLKEYLISEAQYRYPTVEPDLSLFRGLMASVPRQPNSCDCGVFLLHYVERFFESPDQNFLKVGDKVDEIRTWFEHDEIEAKRRQLDELVDRLSVDYEIYRETLQSSLTTADPGCVARSAEDGDEEEEGSSVSSGPSLPSAMCSVDASSMDVEAESNPPDAGDDQDPDEVEVQQVDTKT